MKGRKMQRFKKFTKKNLPTILTWVSAITTAGSLVCTGVATVKAVRKYDEIKKENKDAGKKEILKAVVPYYIPAAGFAAGAITCTFASNHINLKRQRILSGALLASTEAFQAFRKKVSEKMGEEKVKEIEDEQAKEAKVVKAPTVNQNEKITVYDEFAHYKFETTRQRLNDACYEVNRRLNHYDGGYLCRGEVPYAEFYRFLGVKAPERMKAYIWDSSTMFDDFDTGWVDFFFADSTDINDLPIVVMRYSIQPTVQEIYRWKGEKE